MNQIFLLPKMTTETDSHLRSGGEMNGTNLKILVITYIAFEMRDLDWILLFFEVHKSLWKSDKSYDVLSLEK